MNCFSHNERPAIAVCRNCGKASCSDCCDDTGMGMACCFGCAEALRESDALKRRLGQHLGVGSEPPRPVLLPVYALFGIILLAVGVYLSYTRAGIDYLSLAMSAAFFVMAAFSRRRFRSSCQNC